MFPHIPPINEEGIRQRVLMDENAALRAQVRNLSRRVSHLETENAQLRSVVGVAPPPPPPPAGQLYAGNNDNAIHLPMVIESLAVLQDHFRRQNTLKQCSTQGCYRYAFDQTCFREGHMAWCRIHHRIITGTYTSCSVRSEERGDCMSVYWEDRNDWEEIVAIAFRDGKIGHKGLSTQLLNQLLFSPTYTQRAGPPVSLPHGPYPHGNWA